VGRGGTNDKINSRVLSLVFGLACFLCNEQLQDIKASLKEQNAKIEKLLVQISAVEKDVEHNSRAVNKWLLSSK